jgi:DNA-binding CsgD family transcriptional regulator
MEYTSKEIADKLYLSKRTVEGHRTKIMHKIGAKSIARIITYAIEYGIYSTAS